MINICAVYRLSKGKKGKKRQYMNDNVEKYNDIINLPHHISKKHPQMSIDARSAQFASFAALKGYDDEVEETSRLTSEKIEITEGLKMLLDEKMERRYQLQILVTLEEISLKLMIQSNKNMYKSLRKEYRDDIMAQKNIFL